MATSKNPKLQYLKLRGGAWYLNHPIPRDVRAAYPTKSGKLQTHLVRALGTSDQHEAYRRKVVMLPSILAEFEQRKRQLRGMVSSDLAQAFEYRTALREAGNADNYHLSETLSTVVSDVAERIHREGGETPQALRKAQTFVRIAEGAETLEEAFNDWLDRGTLPSRTRAKYRTALAEFSSFLGGHPLLGDMNRANAIRYVDWLNSEGRSQRTKKVVPLSYNSKRDRVMALSAFWNKGLSGRGKAAEPVNPWSKLEITEKPTTPANRWDSMDNVGRPKKRDSFDEADLLAIYDAPGPRMSKATRYPKATLLEVFTLAVVTGARPDELCSLLLGAIKKTPVGYLLKFTDAKTADSDREIPLVHPVAVKIMERRIGKRTDKGAQLFAEFRPKEGHDNMAELVLRALGRHLDRAAGLPESAVPYAARHTLQTLMGNRDDVKDAVMQRYVGHRPTGMTDKHYRSIAPEALLGFAKKVKYPAAVERKMRAELGL